MLHFDQWMEGYTEIDELGMNFDRWAELLIPQTNLDFIRE